VDELVVALELLPEGGVTTVSVRLGLPVRIPLATPLVGPDGTAYTAIDIVVDRRIRSDADSPDHPESPPSAPRR
jgi:hypothetical protein